MTDEQIGLYAACRVACPSPMIRLRSTTDKNRLVVIATRQPFQMPLPTLPRIFPHSDKPQSSFVEIASFPAEKMWFAVDRFLLWDYGAVAFEMAAARFAEDILCGFRRARINVRL